MLRRLRTALAFLIGARRVAALRMWLHDRLILRSLPPVQELRALTRVESVRAVTLGVWYAYGAAVEGDVVEFGTEMGVTARAIARTLRALPAPGSGPRRLHLFDSFEGLPRASSEIDIASPHVQSGVWSAGTCRGVSPVQLMDICAREYPSEFITIHPGWFANTVAALPGDTRFAMVHVDSDLYESAMDALVPLFQRGMVSPGALILFDDWNCNRGDPAWGEQRAWADLVERFHIIATADGRYSWNGARFIVHGYGASA